MQGTDRVRKKRSASAVLAAFLLILISFASILGIILLVAQERSRLRLLAEYRAFQLASVLLRAVDLDDTSRIGDTQGLVGFGAYTLYGEAVFRYGTAPASVRPDDSLLPPVFDGNVISFLRPLGGGPMMGDRRAQPLMPGAVGPNAEGGQGSVMGGMPRRRGQGMQTGIAGGRLVFMAYDAASLRSGERNLYIGGFLVTASLALAFGFFLYSNRRLDAYREREAHNRELVALGEAARTLAHEIKNPLGIVKIQCALLRKSLNSGEPKGNDGETSGYDGKSTRNENVPAGPLRELRIIEEETDRLARLASRIRDFLSAGSANPELISLRSLFDSLKDRYGDRVNVHISERLQGENPGFVSVDPVRLDQMMDNVLANAFESMEEPETQPTGAMITVDISAEVRRNRLVVSIADRGKGISAGDAKRVFDLFFTTKPSGSGIGLALTKRYAEASGGTIRFEPRQGGGSVFILELPFQGDIRA